MISNILGIAHIGIPTSDVERSIEFYKRLGFKLIVMRHNLERHHFAFMENSGCIIGLPQPLNEPEIEKLAKKAGAIDHFALLCEDIDSLYREMKADGHTFLTDGINSTAAWAPRQCRCFMILGPDDVKIEFCQLS